MGTGRDSKEMHRFPIESMHFPSSICANRKGLASGAALISGSKRLENAPAAETVNPPLQAAKKVVNSKVYIVQMCTI